MHFRNWSNSLVHLWLCHTAHCTEYLHGSVSAEKVGQREVGGVTCNVLCTWWLPGLRSYKVAMVGSEWAISHPSYMNRLGKVSQSIHSQNCANHLLLVQFSVKFFFIIFFGNQQIFPICAKVQWNSNGRTQGNTSCYNGTYLARANKRVVPVK